MEPTLGGFGIVGLGAEGLAGGAKPFEPVFVFGAELLLEFLAKALGEGGTFAVGRDGDLEVAALDDGAVVEVAVIDVVDGVAEDVAAISFREHLSVEFGDGGGGHDEKGAVKIFGFEGFGRPVDFAVADPFVEGGMEPRGNDVDTCAGLEQAGNFLCGNGATTDDEHAAVGELEERGKEVHGWASIGWKKWRVASDEWREKKSENRRWKMENWNW